MMKHKLTIYSVNELGPELRKIRTDKKMRIVELQDKSGISISTLSMVEQGKQYPRLNTLNAWLAALDIDEVVIKSSIKQ